MSAKSVLANLWILGIFHRAASNHLPFYFRTARIMRIMRLESADRKFMNVIYHNDTQLINNTIIIR